MALRRSAPPFARLARLPLRPSRAAGAPFGVLLGALLVLLILPGLGCGDDGAPAVDSSTPTDSGSSDSGSPDSGSPADSSTGTDAGTDAAADAAADAATDADATADAATDAGGDAAATTGCTEDSDCRAFSDYCGGCFCRALGTTDPDPVCSGMMVTCFVDPCTLEGAAFCDTTTGACGLRPTP